MIVEADELVRRFEFHPLYSPEDQARMDEIIAILEPVTGGYTNEQMRLVRELHALEQKPFDDRFGAPFDRYVPLPEGVRYNCITGNIAAFVGTHVEPIRPR
jgi:hypothetical protein